MEILKGKSIEDALSKEYRQYLAGRLKKEQPFLKHIDDDIEIGISNYVTFTADKPHMHTQCTEHNYVLRGKMKVKLLDGSCEEYEFSEGDLFVLRPGTPYAAKNEAGTRVLFIKSPGINDKTEVAVDVETQRWLLSWQ